MEGGPSQLDLFDHKPGLEARYNEDLPDSIRNGQRVSTMTSGQARFPVAPSRFRFHRAANNEGGVMLSELLPHTAEMAHEICFIRSMHTQAINHEPGITFFQTGNEQPGRPSFGSWMSYGLGSENEDLPAFVVMITQGYGNMQALSARFWDSGFLPSEHQGCKLRSGKDVLYLHAIGQFVLGDAGHGFCIATALEFIFVDSRCEVEHGAAISPCSEPLEILLDHSSSLRPVVHSEWNQADLRCTLPQARACWSNRMSSWLGPPSMCI